MEVKESARNTGITTSGLLTLLFVYLKITHEINWSWWWVLAPTWITYGLGLTLSALIVLGVLAYSYWKHGR